MDYLQILQDSSIFVVLNDSFIIAKVLSEVFFLQSIKLSNYREKFQLS